MTEELFEKAWDYWTGLFPVWTRKRGAYFHALRYINDKDFKKVYHLVVGMTDDFPSVRKIRDAATQINRAKSPELPAAKIVTAELSDEQLKTNIEKLKARVNEARLQNTGGKDNPYSIRVMRLYQAGLKRLQDEEMQRMGVDLY